jgi:hypothetical protein
MSEEDTSTDTDSTADATTQAAGKTFTQADLDRIVADRVARERAKYADYGDLKKKAAAAMTEQERAVAEAEQRGRSAALSESGARLVKAEFRAAAAGRLDKDALAAYLEDVDLKKFVGDDGEPDTKAIEARIAKLAGSQKATDFDGGARTPAGKPANMNDLIRRHAGVQV